MPPRPVYGKRSRAVYDPFAAFSSPHRSPLNDGQQKHVAEVAKTVIGGGTHSQGRGKEATGHRKALEEINANTVLSAVIPAQNKTVKRRRPGRIVAEDDEDEGVRKETANDLRGRKQSGSRSKQASQHHHNVVYEVPLFYDAHDYKSEEEDVEHDETKATTTVKKAETQCLQEERWKESQVETPSISILPPTPPPLDTYNDHCAELLSLSSHPRTSFSEWSNQLSSHFSISKIAEASFGEVYRLSLLERLSGFSSVDESVFKIIALRPPENECSAEKSSRTANWKKFESMSKATDVANEVRLLQRMSTTPGFTNFRDVRVIQGRPPSPFVKAFRDFNAMQKARKKDLSNFPDPGKKASYSDDQLWAVIEMQDAGTDLECLVESGQCTKIWFAWDAFWQVVLSLAKGEESAEFEHRDLHLGNICVRQVPNGDLKIDTKRKLNFTGLETTVIDYTISRALLPEGTMACQDVAKDSALFEGDSTEDYQYDIYRYMRGMLFLDDPYADLGEAMQRSERSWQQYHPITNLLWLHFMLYKLLEQIEWPSATKAPPRKRKTEHAEWKRANDLEHVLLRVQELLYPDLLYKNEMRSASDLVGLALEECWIDAEDVVGIGLDDGGEEDELTSQLGILSLQQESVLSVIDVVQEPTVVAPEAKPRQAR